METEVSPETAQHIETFRKRRTIQWIVTAPVIALVIGLMWFRDHSQEQLYGVSADKFAVVFLIALVAAFAFTFKNWRCPACNGYLGRAMNPKHCVKCGAQLL
jgi:bacteriorhodopsin